MPMRKATILLNISHDGEFQDIAMTVTNDLIPKSTTINKIMQFAASYRAEKISKNRFVEYSLN